MGAHPLPQTPTPLTFDHAWRLEPSDRRRTGCDLDARPQAGPLAVGALKALDPSFCSADSVAGGRIGHARSAIPAIRVTR